MVHVAYDSPHHAVILEYAGNVTAEETRRAHAEMNKLIPNDGKGFKVLVDLCGIDTMELEVEDEIKEAMSSPLALGAQEVVHVLPDAESDFTFETLVRYFAPKKINCVNFRTRADAQKYLDDSPPV
jgi:hypothetical protein